jgi:hypothetical protein
MKPLLQATFRLEGRTFIEIPDSITRMANVKTGQIFTTELAPNGDIVLKRMEESP